MPLSRRKSIAFVFAVVIPSILSSCQTVRTPAPVFPDQPKQSAEEACALQQMAAHSATIDVFTTPPFDSTGARIAAESRAAIANIELQTCLVSHL
jgi:hypothetical protein